MAGLCYCKYLLLFGEALIVISVDTTKDTLCSITSFRSSGHSSPSLAAVATNKRAVCATPSQPSPLEKILEELLHSGGGAGRLPA